MKEIFGNSIDDGYDFEGMLNILEENWKIRAIYSEREKLFSSDHPSLLFSIEDEIAFAFLPISPHYGVVAVDQRKVQISGNRASEKDNGNLNALQAMKCHEYVYSDYDLSEFIGENEPLTDLLQKERMKSFASEKSWKPDYIDYTSSPPGGFSFLKKTA